jgi:hypothetical protein
VRGCDRVYHCAAEVSSADRRHREIYECNVLGAHRVDLVVEIDGRVAVGREELDALAEPWRA